MDRIDQIGLRRRPRVAGPEPALIEQLAQCDTTDLADMMHGAGVMDPGIRPLHVPSKTIAGPAITVTVPTGSQEVRKVAMSLAQPGDVLVVDARGLAVFAVLGGNLAQILQEKGVAGVIIDGYVRDQAQIRALGLPVFCRGHTVAAAPKTGPGEVNVPVACGGVAVAPGDVIVGDSNGVVVVPKEATAEVLSLVKPA